MFAAVLPGCLRHDAAPETPVILRLVSDPDLGDVWSGETLSTSVLIKNESDYLVVVDRVTTTCSCSVASVSDTTIAPSETASVELTIDEQAVASDQPGRFSVGLTVEISNGQAVEFALLANRRAFIPLAHRRVSLPDELVAGLPVTLEFPADVPEGSGVTMTPLSDDLVVDEVVHEQDAGVIRCTMTPADPPGGPWTGSVDVIAAGTSSPDRLVRITLTGFVATPLELNPSPVVLDSAAAPVTAVLTRTDGNDIADVSVECPIENVSCECQRLDDGGWSLRFTAAPQRAGTIASANLTIIASLGGAEKRLRVPLSVFTPPKVVREGER